MTSVTQFNNCMNNTINSRTTNLLPPVDATSCISQLITISFKTKCQKSSKINKLGWNLFQEYTQHFYIQYYYRLFKSNVFTCITPFRINLIDFF